MMERGYYWYQDGPNQPWQLVQYNGEFVMFCGDGQEHQLDSLQGIFGPRVEAYNGE